jgi:hypothetical protein
MSLIPAVGRGMRLGMTVAMAGSNACLRSVWHTNRLPSETYGRSRFVPGSGTASAGVSCVSRRGGPACVGVRAPGVCGFSWLRNHGKRRGPCAVPCLWVRPADCVQLQEQVESAGSCAPHRMVDVATHLCEHLNGPVPARHWRCTAAPPLRPRSSLMISISRQPRAHRRVSMARRSRWLSRW